MSINTPSFEVPARVQHELLDVYGLQIRSRVEGGLSAARIWRCDGVAGPVCLRCWPPEHPNEKGLRLIHEALQRANTSKLAFVPRIFPTSTGTSFVDCDCELWELTQWMPGAADYRQYPSIVRLTNAVRALADLHACWHQWMPSQGASRAIAKRIELLKHWLGGPTALRSIAKLPLSDGMVALMGETSRALLALGPRLLDELQTTRNDALTLHPVLRDVWSDHILFDSDRVSGIIDYGALAIDTPAADLARMLGTFEPDDQSLRQLGVELYHERLGCLNPEWSLVDLLDRSGTLLAAAQWMDWLVIEQREFPMDRERLIDRWRGLLARANRICEHGDTHGGHSSRTTINPTITGGN